MLAVVEKEKKREIFKNIYIDGKKNLKLENYYKDTRRVYSKLGD